jgi:hypothetical protein
MTVRFLIIVFSFFLLSVKTLFPQVKPVFSGEPGNYRQELTSLMGISLNGEQTLNLNSFLTKWDSTGFSQDAKRLIINISNQMVTRQMRAVPHFNQLLKTLNDFSDYKINRDLFTRWLTGLSETPNPDQQTNIIEVYSV